MFGIFRKIYSVLFGSFPAFPRYSAVSHSTNVFHIITVVYFHTVSVDNLRRTFQHPLGKILV